MWEKWGATYGRNGSKTSFTCSELALSAAADSLPGPFSSACSAASPFSASVSASAGGASDSASSWLLHAISLAAARRSMMTWYSRMKM